NDHAVGLGDVDGDGYDDFALTSSSVVHVYQGGSGFSSNPSSFTFNATNGTPDGRVARVGNVTGAADADLVFGTTAGVQLSFRTGRDSFGNPIWGSQFFANSTITPAPTGSLTGVGDVDNDGSNDFLIGNANGDAYLIKGGASVPNVPLMTLGGVASA